MSIEDKVYLKLGKERKLFGKDFISKPVFTEQDKRELKSATQRPKVGIEKWKEEHWNIRTSSYNDIRQRPIPKQLTLEEQQKIDEWGNNFLLPKYYEERENEKNAELFSNNFNIYKNTFKELRQTRLSNRSKNIFDTNKLKLETLFFKFKKEDFLSCTLPHINSTIDVRNFIIKPEFDFEINLKRCLFADGVKKEKRFYTDILFELSFKNLCKIFEIVEFDFSSKKIKFDSISLLEMMIEQVPDFRKKEAQFSLLTVLEYLPYVREVKLMANIMSKKYFLDLDVYQNQYELYKEFYDEKEACILANLHQDGIGYIIYLIFLKYFNL